MKRILLALMAMMVLSPALMASDKKKKAAEQKSEAAKTPEAASKENKDASEINWLSIDEVQAKMRQEPRKVFMDMYTDWCGWCKRMEATTFHNPNVVKYMNEKYYCVRFNAERKDTIRFMGKYYYFDPEKKANTLAYEFMRGQLSYPTGIFLEERFQNPIPVPGYQDVKTWEVIVKYIGDNAYKGQNFQDYQKSFISGWDMDPAAAPRATPDSPPVHQ